MPLYIRQQDRQALEGIINDVIDQLVHEGLIGGADYLSLSELFNSFEGGSNTAQTLPVLAQEIQPFSNEAAAMIASFQWVNIRSSNYPSGWDLASTTARDQYRASHPGTSPVTWVCPGFGLQQPHNVNNTDCTIDHVIPVASHWNGTGNNTDRTTRRAWYYDTSNHTYLCQSCNSAKGSGNITYTFVTGHAYSNQ